MGEEDKAAFGLIRDSLSNINLVITAVRDGQLETERSLNEHQTKIADDLSKHQAELAKDLAAYNKEQVDRVNEIAKELAAYKLQSEKDCNNKHRPIDEKFSALVTKDHAAEQVAQQEQGWGSKWNVYLYPIGIIVAIVIAILGRIK